MDDDLEIKETALTISDAGLQNSSARLLPKGTVALSRTATVGKCVILGRQMATSQDFACYVCGPQIHNKYLLHLFRSMQHTWAGLSGGSTHKTIYMPTFRKLQIPLPPLAEQVRIANCLFSVDEAVQSTRAAIEQTRRVKEGLLRDLMTKGIGHRHFKKTEIGRVPAAWAVLPLGETTSSIQNGLYRPAEDYGDGTPIVRIDSFQHGSRIRLNNLNRVRLQQDDATPYLLRRGDIVLNRVNSLSHIAKSVIIPEIAEPTVFESNMMRLRVNSQLLPDFLLAVLTLPYSRRHFQHRAKKAVAQASVNQGDVRALSIPLPSVDEQRKILIRLEAVEGSEQAAVTSESRFEQLRTGLLQDLLTGKVRVNV